VGTNATVSILYKGVKGSRVGELHLPLLKTNDVVFHGTLRLSDIGRAMNRDSGRNREPYFCFAVKMLTALVGDSVQGCVC